VKHESRKGLDPSFAKCETKVAQQLPMHIISRKKLLEAAKRFPDADGQLDGWYRTAKSAKWKSLADVRRTYSHADPVKVGDVVYTIFNIGGNKYRLITEIFYEDRTILVRHVLTHQEYDKEAWKK
jgi:mRNA interferase HigB